MYAIISADFGACSRVPLIIGFQLNFLLAGTAVISDKISRFGSIHKWKGLFVYVCSGDESFSAGKVEYLLGPIGEILQYRLL